MAAKFHSVIIWTEDMQRLLPFYRDVLGFKPAMETPGFVVLQTNGSNQLAIGVHSEVKGAARDPNRVMVNLSVASCQSEFERLSGKGVTFLREPGKDDAGPMIATFTDPDGNVLQLLEE